MTALTTQIRFTKTLGDGTFNNVGPNLNFNQSIFAMSLSMSDFENDDDDDFYISNDALGNLLLRFEDGSFLNVAQNLGVAVNDVCWGSTVVRLR